MHKDASNIFNLYLEAVEEQPKMTTDKQGNKFWYLNGELHRADAPAVELTSGAKSWYLHGNLHRKDGPAVEYADGTKEWCLNGKMHREDGPAYENPHTGYKAWYLHNIHYNTAEAWAEAVLKLHNKPHDDAAVHAFLRTILKKDAEAAL